MKIYCFYLFDTVINDKIYPAVSLDDIKFMDKFSYVLYGVTSNKKYAQRFQRTRNNKFFMKTTIMSEEEYTNFIDNRTDLIIDEKLYKFSDMKNGKINTNMVFILSTESEYDKICFDYPMFINSIYKDINQGLTYLSPEIFKLNISNALKNIFNFYGILDWLKMLDDIPFDNFNINTLSLYLHVFSNTLNIERIDDLCNFTGLSKNQI